MLILLFYDYGATILPNMEIITKNEKRLFMRKNAIRLQGKYQATMKNNFQFDYGATMAGATINED